MPFFKSLIAVNYFSLIGTKSLFFVRANWKAVWSKLLVTCGTETFEDFCSYYRVLCDSTMLLKMGGAQIVFILNIFVGST